MVCIHLFELVFLLSSGKYLEVKLLFYLTITDGSSFFSFQGNSMLFCIMAASVCNSTDRAQALLSLCSLLLDSCSDRGQAVPNCGFELHHPKDYWHWAPFHVSLGHLPVFSGKMSIQVLCQFLHQVVCLF